MQIPAFAAAAALAAGAAFGAPAALPTPAALQRSIEQAMTRCLQRAGPDGTACYEPARARWREAVDDAKDRIGLSRNADCAAALQQIEQRWHGHADGLLRARAIGVLSPRADDELELPLLAHLYDMTHWLARQPACRPRG